MNKDEKIKALKERVAELEAQMERDKSLHNYAGEVERDVKAKSDLWRSMALTSMVMVLHNEKTPI